MSARIFHIRQGIMPGAGARRRRLTRRRTARKDEVQHQSVSTEIISAVAEAVPRAMKTPGAHLAAGEHAYREGQPLAQLPVAVKKTGTSFPRFAETGYDVQQQDTLHGIIGWR